MTCINVEVIKHLKNNYSTRRNIIYIYSFMALLLTSSPGFTANKTDGYWKGDTVNINIGTYLTNRDTNIRIDSRTLGQGTQINTEDDLNLSKNKSIFRADMYVRLAQYHRLDFSYYDLSRDATNVIETTIQYGDVTFPISTAIRSDFNLIITKAAYTYFILRDAEIEWGFSAGLFIQDYEIVLQQIGGANAQASADTLAPLPVIGTRGAWSYSDKWRLQTSAEIFSLSYDNYDGHLTDVILAIEYNIFKDVGLGIGYNYTSFKLLSDADEFIGEAKISYGGIIVYTKVHF